VEIEDGEVEAGWSSEGALRSIEIADHSQTARGNGPLDQRLKRLREERMIVGQQNAH
jgi:hypothetical protein